MFEAAELGRKISKEDFKTQVPELRAQLLEMQFALSKTNVPVMILVSGIDAAGRGEVINVLSEWLDPRGIETFAFEEPTDEERERPKFWRFWRTVPPRGRIALYFGAWYVDPIHQFAYGDIDQAQLDKDLEQIRRMETMLVEDGALILKFWLHLSKKEQRKRLKDLEKDKHSPRQVSKQDWKHAEMYDQFAAAAERTISHTNTGEAPWTLVECTDTRYRDLTVAQQVLDSLRKRIDQANRAAAAPTHKQVLRMTSDIAPVLANSPKAAVTILDRVDLTQAYDGKDKDYDEELHELQGRISRLAWEAHAAKRSTVLVFEGWDAGGKGGAIRRITQAMDARLYRVISVAAPTDEERAHHYLWRFTRHIPRAGHFTLYDRSWYGRVLVERVEGFASEVEWMRSYLEINAFEEMQANHGTVIMKFWLHLSPDEQLRRFKEREQIAYKKHKITDEDWRNREKWDEYKTAVNDMVARTSTHHAPWHLIPAEDKKYARLEILRIVCNRLEQALGQDNKGNDKPKKK
jgi:polyphosphate:AMP phosphotransferase